MESPVDTPDDERLRQLLEVERRLQALVRAAQEDGRRRIAVARAAGEDRLAAARDAAARADAEQARLENIEHQRTLAAIEAAHQSALANIGSLADARVDELARWTLVEVIGGDGDRP